MVSIAVYIYKKFGSKHLLEILSSLGFLAPYEEASKLEGSYVLQAKRAKIKESADQFTQFTLYNADFNVNTLDGKNNFHAVGAIVVVPPK